MAKLIDGKAFAEGLRGRIAKAVAELKAGHGFTPGLAVVLVGEDPASKVYVANKAKQTVEVGMNSWEYKLPAETPEAEVLALVEKLNADPAVHGILVQLPLPKHIDSTKVLTAISPAKDVDGFHVVNVGKLSTGQDSLVPCTPVGSVMLARDVLGKLDGIEAVVIGRSNIVGKPVAQLLLAENCTVTIAHSRTKDLPAVVRRDHAGSRRRRPHDDCLPALQHGEGRLRGQGDQAAGDVSLRPSLLPFWGDEPVRSYPRAALARSIDSMIIFSASAASPQPRTLTHFPGSRSL